MISSVFPRASLPHIMLSTLIGILLVVLTGCSSETKPSPDTATATSPRILNGEYGPVNVTGKVDRVVALSSDWLGTLAAIKAPIVGFRTAGPAAPVDTPPWLADAIPTEATHLTGDFTVESVAALDPDLIVGPSWLVTEDLYSKLADIAPTFVDHEDSAGTEFGNWERQLDDAGSLLSTEVAPVKTSVQDLVRTAAAKYHLNGTGSLAVCQGGQIGAVTSAEAGVSYLLKPFGLTPLSLPGQQIGLRTMVSAENADLLYTSDLLIIGPTDTAGSTLDRFTANRQGKPTVVVPMSILNAFNTPDASSIPILITEITNGLVSG